MIKEIPTYLGTQKYKIRKTSRKLIWVFYFLSLSVHSLKAAIISDLSQPVGRKTWNEEIHLC